MNLGNLEVRRENGALITMEFGEALGGYGQLMLRGGKRDA